MIESYEQMRLPKEKYRVKEANPDSNQWQPLEDRTIEVS